MRKYGKVTADLLRKSIILIKKENGKHESENGKKCVEDIIFA